ncbi:hypothetical protein GCM10023324_35060 [Streptomyces youssoufiensis]
MARNIAEYHSNLAGGVRHPVQGAATEEGEATPGLQLQQQTQRGALPGTWRPEQSGDESWTRFEGEVIDDGRLVAAGGTGQPDGLDHGFSREA